MNEPSKRPSLRRAASERRRQQQHNAAAPPPSGPAPRFEQVRAKCGHPVPMELYADGRDKFRDARRGHIAERDCPECRQKAHEERTRSAMEAARLRRREKAQELARAKDRLPHGSRFTDLAWDAEKGVWTGTLTIPGSQPASEAASFTASATGVFRLLRILDDLYRQSLGAAPAIGAPAEEGESS